MAELCPPHYDRPRLETFKMCKYIVDVTTEQIQPPEYLRKIDGTKDIDFQMVLASNQKAIKLHKEMMEQEKDTLPIEGAEVPKLPELTSFKINPLQLNDWPSAEQLGMDNPQYIAFQSAITQELAIIQGPPGMFNLLSQYSRSLYVVSYRNWKNLHWPPNNEATPSKFSDNFRLSNFGGVLHK